jgi:hypothetical protein
VIGKMAAIYKHAILGLSEEEEIMVVIGKTGL